MGFGTYHLHHSLNRLTHLFNIQPYLFAKLLHKPESLTHRHILRPVLKIRIRLRPIRHKRNLLLDSFLHRGHVRRHPRQRRERTRHVCEIRRLRAFFTYVVRVCAKVAHDGVVLACGDAAEEVFEALEMLGYVNEGEEVGLVGMVFGGHEGGEDAVHGVLGCAVDYGEGLAGAWVVGDGDSGAEGAERAEAEALGVVSRFGFGFGFVGLEEGGLLYLFWQDLHWEIQMLLSWRGVLNG